MNMKDWYDAMEHNRKRAERRGENIEISHSYTISSNTNVNDLAHQIASDMAHDYHESYASVYDEAYDTAQEWIEDYHNQYDYDDDYDDDDYDDGDEDYDDFYDYEDSDVEIQISCYSISGLRQEEYHYTITKDTTAEILAKQIASNLSQDLKEPYDKFYTEAYQQAQEIIDDYHYFESNGYGSSNIPPYCLEFYNEDEESFSEDCNVHNSNPDEDAVANALYDLELALNEAIYSSDSSITSENNTIVINTGKRIFHLVTDAITQQAIAKITQKMNRIFNSEDRTNIELLIADLKTALNMADIQKFKLITYYDCL